MKIIKLGIASLVFILLLNLFAIQLLACSFSGMLPSNYDLVKGTGAILLAEAISFDVTTEAVGIQQLPTKFTFKILEVLKGDFTQDLLADGGTDRYLGRSDEQDFSRARPGAYTGACTAYDYQAGKQFLLFVNKSSAGWIVSGPPHSRINEEVIGSNAPWVTAVRHYIRISQLQNYEAEKAELMKLLENAKIGADPEKYPVGLVKDIENYFTLPYPTKPYSDLIAIYNNSSKNVREDVLRALIDGNHTEAKQFFQKLLQSGEWIEYASPVCRYLIQTNDRTFVNTLASAYHGIKDKLERLTLISALIKLADEKDSEFMLSALRSADERQATELALWFARYPAKEATEIVGKLVDGKYSERWELAFSLAGLGDEKILEWAKEIIDSSDKNRWMGYYIIARSPLDEADKLAKAIIQNSTPKDLTSLIQGYRDSLNPNRWDRLRDAININSNNPEVNSWLRKTLEQMAGGGDNKAAELLSTMK